MSARAQAPLRALGLAALLLVAQACGSPKSAFDAKLDKGNFGFVFGQGSSWYGYDVVRITASGECWYTFSELDYDTETVVWRSARFTVPRETLRALRQVLNDVGYFSLEDEYKGPSTSTRAQWFFKVRIGEHKKAVFMDNDFPPPARTLERFVTDHVIGPHRAEFSAAPVIPAAHADEKPGF